MSFPVLLAPILLVVAEARGGDIHVVPANGDSHSGSPQHFLYLQDNVHVRVQSESQLNKNCSGDDKENTHHRLENKNAIARLACC